MLQGVVSCAVCGTGWSLANCLLAVLYCNIKVSQFTELVNQCLSLEVEETEILMEINK